MRVVHGSERFGREVRGVITIGNFDGVHLGHRRLLEVLIETAGQRDAPSCVYTFEPAPQRVLRPESCPPRILPLGEKLRLLGEAGVDIVVIEAFSVELGQNPPQWFAHEILESRLDPVAMVVGYDFRYGNERAGDIDLLRQQLPELPIDAVEALVLEDGTTVSSSRIRESVATGDLHRASELLGRPFHLRGTVIEGEARGRALGFPTANISREGELLPPPGVYAVEARVVDGELRPAVANLGVRPTFEGSRLSIEVHLLDFEGDLYGERMDVLFRERLRGERRFENVGALKRQVEKDIQAARAILTR
ncbi:MAG TPA: riboflavin biosynthesis protein RibF [Myxococcota bacterium]|nr:riboflavin biosynthesis protein RibF [Myxococcota bacterium]